MNVIAPRIPEELLMFANYEVKSPVCPDLEKRFYNLATLSRRMHTRFYYEGLLPGKILDVPVRFYFNESDYYGPYRVLVKNPHKRDELFRKFGRNTVVLLHDEKFLVGTTHSRSTHVLYVTVYRELSSTVLEDQEYGELTDFLYEVLTPQPQPSL